MKNLNTKNLKTYKVKVCSEVIYYSEVEATSEDEAHFAVFDELKWMEESYGFDSFRWHFNEHKDNIIEVSPMYYDVMGVPALPQCKDYDPHTEDRRKPSETNKCA